MKSTVEVTLREYLTKYAQDYFQFEKLSWLDRGKDLLRREYSDETLDQRIIPERRSKGTIRIAFTGDYRPEDGPVYVHHHAAKTIYLTRIQEIAGDFIKPAWKEKEEETYVSDDVHIHSLDLSARTYNALARRGFFSIPMLQVIGDDVLLETRNFGKKSLREVRRKLSEWEHTKKEERLERLARSREWHKQWEEEHRSTTTRPSVPSPAAPHHHPLPDEEDTTEEIAGDATIMWRDRCIFLKTMTYADERQGGYLMVCRDLGVSAGGRTQEDAMKSFISAVGSHLRTLEDKGQLEQALTYLTPPNPSEETNGEFLWTWKDRSIRLDYVLRRYDHDGHYQMLLPQLAISAVGETEESVREELLGQAAHRLEILDDGQGALDRVLFHINAIPPTPSQPSPDLLDEVASSLPVPRSSG